VEAASLPGLTSHLIALTVETRQRRPSCPSTGNVRPPPQRRLRSPSPLPVDGLPSNTPASMCDAVLNLCAVTRVLCDVNASLGAAALHWPDSGRLNGHFRSWYAPALYRQMTGGAE
jgi:hypothetical protein